MPLDEREQRILEEIEAQFYQEDPDFAQTVRDTTLQSFTGRRVRIAIVGLVVGLVLMLVFFPNNQYIALGGFILMVLSVGWIVTALRRRQTQAGGGAEGWIDGLRRKWRRSR